MWGIENRVFLLHTPQKFQIKKRREKEMDKENSINRGKMINNKRYEIIGINSRINIQRKRSLSVV